jgi:hypothetical protein
MTIPYDWVLPVPSIKKRWVIEIPHGSFYEELIWGGISELLDEYVESANDDELDTFRDAILQSLNSIEELPTMQSTVKMIRAMRMTTVSENLSAATWTPIPFTSAVGATVTTDGRIEIPLSGEYAINWGIYARFGAQSTSRILVNGLSAADGMGLFAGTASGIAAVPLIGAALLDLEAGDLIRLEAYSRSGGELAAPTLYPGGQQTVAWMTLYGVV